MTPKERVYAALEHREPDRIPWGEHSIDYNVYEDILGRETLVQAKMKQIREENARLKKLVADLSLDKDMLQSVIRKNSLGS